MDANVLCGRNKLARQFGTIPGAKEPASKEADLCELRLRYNAAYAAYQSCIDSLNEMPVSDQTPRETLLKNESTALDELNKARGQLLAAIASVHH